MASRRDLLGTLGSVALLAATGRLLPSAAAAPAPSQFERFSVTVVGEGPDLVLLPGLGCSSAVWDGVVGQLAGRWRLHLVQVAGFAGEPARGNAEGTVLVPLAEALRDYLDAAGSGPLSIIGHSMGGLLTLMLGVARPERIDRLMVVDALPYLGLLFGPMADAETVETAARGLQTRLLRADAAEYRRFQVITIDAMVTGTADRTRVLEWVLSSDRTVVAQALYEVMTQDLRQALPRIAPPVTVVYAWNAALLPSPDVVDEIFATSFAALPQHRLIRVDAARHFVMLDQPQRFAEIIAEFLS